MVESTFFLAESTRFDGKPNNEPISSILDRSEARPHFEGVQLERRRRPSLALGTIVNPLQPSYQAMAPREKRERKKTSALSDVVSREYTIHLHKHIHGQGFKYVRPVLPTCHDLVVSSWLCTDMTTRCCFAQRAPRAIKAIVEFAQKTMNTKDVRIDPGLNAAVWNKGVRNVPRRIRIRLARESCMEDHDQHLDAHLTLLTAPHRSTQRRRRRKGEAFHHRYRRGERQDPGRLQGAC